MTPIERQESRARRAIAHQIGWAWTAQILIMLVQLVYSAITARLLSPTAFGEFAVATAVTSLGLLLLGTGLANAAARMTDHDESTSRALSALGLLAGVLLTTLIVCTASFWSRLWGQPGSAQMIQAVALAGLLTPWSGVLIGLLRNRGRTPLVIGLNACGALAGALIGATAVTYTGSPLALALSSGVNSILFVAFSWIALGIAATPTWRLHAAKSHFRFAGLAQLDATLTYTTFAIPQWLMSRSLGAATLGQWNRAVALGAVPIQSVTSAVGLVIYPKFRHHRSGDSHVKGLWSALLVSAGLTMIPAGCVAAVFVPFLINLVLGPGWETAALMGGFLAFAATLGFLEQLLASALEASNNFRCLWPGRVASGSVIALGTGLMIITHSWVSLAAAFAVARIMGHIVSLMCAGNKGLVASGQVLRWYTGGLAIGAVLAASPVMVSGYTGTSIVASTSALLIYLGSLWRWRRHVTPIAHLLSEPEKDLTSPPIA